MNNDIFKVQKILWAALGFSQLLFLFMAVSTNPMRLDSLGQEWSNSENVNMFSLIALAIAAAAWFLPKVFLAASSGSPRSPNVTDPDLARKCHLPLILRLALADSVVMFGFLSAAMLKNSAAILPFSIVGITLVGLSFPSKNLYWKWMTQ